MSPTPMLAAPSPAGEELPQRVLTLPSGVRVRTFDVGKGPVALLLHGNPDNADEWEPLIRLLREDFRCIAPDLPGYGRRGASFALPDSYEYTVDAQVVFVTEVLNALEVAETVTLVVHDIGGIMGVPWASRNTHRVHGVVYTNTVAFPNFGWFPLARLFGQRGTVGRAIASQNMKLLGQWKGWIFRSQFSKQNPQLDRTQIDRFTRDFALNDVAKETTLRQFRTITRLEFFDRYDEMVKGLTRDVPTLTLWGDGDAYLQTHFSEQLYARKTTVVPGVGHWVPIVAAERLAAEIRALRS
jgi:pimeloyl-ACP methyl ester carboxylesterase